MTDQTAGVIVRTARLIDLDDIVRLWSGLLAHHRHLNPRLYQTEIHAPASFRAFVRRKVDDSDGLVLIAEYEGETVGYLMGTVGQRAPVYVVRTVGMVFDLMVESRVRKRGIGRTLVQRAIDEFKHRGIHDVQVNYDPRNEAATQFWAGLGFSTLLHEAYLHTD